MTDADFQELTTLWQSASYEEDVAEVKASMTRHIRLAKIWTGVELVLSVAAIVFFGVLIAAFPSPTVLVVGLMLMALVVGAFWYGFKSRFRFLDVTAGSARDVVKAAIARSNAAVKRYKVGLYGLIPALVLGNIFGQFIAKNAKEAGQERIFKHVFSDEWEIILAVIILAILVAVNIFLLRREARKGRQLRALLTRIEDET